MVSIYDKSDLFGFKLGIYRTCLQFDDGKNRLFYLVLANIDWNTIYTVSIIRVRNIRVGDSLP